MDPTQLAQMLAQNYAPPPDLVNMAIGQPGAPQFGGVPNMQPGALTPPMQLPQGQPMVAPPGENYQMLANPQTIAPPAGPGTDWLKMLTGMGGAGQLGAALKPGDFRAPAPYMGGIGGKPAVQSQVGMGKHPQPNIQALLAYLGQGQR